MSDDKTVELLQDILAAQVLVLAEQIRAQKAAKGTTTTSDLTYEAVQLIKQKKSSILQIL